MMNFVKEQNGNELEYFNKHVDLVDGHDYIFEYTYLEQIYICHNDVYMIIDMNTLNIIEQVGCNFIIEEIINDKCIYSIHHKTFHKKTQYTKHKKITCNIGNNCIITLLLSSDISNTDMHNMSVDIKGIDCDNLKGCLVSKDNLIILNSIK